MFVRFVNVTDEQSISPHDRAVGDDPGLSGVGGPNSDHVTSRRTRAARELVIRKPWPAVGAWNRTGVIDCAGKPPDVVHQMAAKAQGPGIGLGWEFSQHRRHWCRHGMPVY
jgi:hypothetical protein